MSSNASNACTLNETVIKLKRGMSTLLILHYNFPEAPGRFLALIAVILSYVQVVTAFTSASFEVHFTTEAPSESR